MRGNSQSIISQPYSREVVQIPLLYYVKKLIVERIYFCHQIDELYVTKVGVFIIEHWLVTTGRAVTTYP